MHIKISEILRVAGLIALIFALITAIPACSKKANESSSQKFAPADSNEIDPRSFVPKGKLQVEQSFQDYLIRIYRDWESNDEYEGSFEILKNGQRVYALRGWSFRVGSIYGDSDLEEMRKKEGFTQLHLQDSLLRIGNDITGDGKPDLVVSEWTGGAHCCYLFHIFEIGKEFRRLATIYAADGDLTQFEDLDGDSNLEVVLYDFTFAYWYASFAFSPAPKVILHFRDGAYHLASNLMRKPAPPQQQLEKQAKEVHKILKDFGEIPYSSASNLWGVMLDLIYTGNMNLAWKFLDMAWPNEVTGKEEFLKDFKEQLATSPYWPEIQAMNAK